MAPRAGRDLHPDIVRAAMLAPSVHNTQPWRFSSAGDGLELWSDPSRQLAVLDPDGRQLHLSCGAALLHARVAARGLGLDAETSLLPDPGDPTHLAHLDVRPGSDPSAQELALAAAIGQRHTYRESFAAQPLPDALLEQLRMAAEREGALLRPLTDPDDLLALAALLARADDAEQRDPAYRQELDTWVRPLAPEDGIARAALPADPERGSSLRLRDFAPGAPAPARSMPPPAEHPYVVVLASTDDTPTSWLQAGQALGAVLLRAAQDGVLAQPLGQVTDLVTFRLRLGRAIGLLGTPQLALRMGYAAVTEQTAGGQTARRDVADVLARADEDTEPN